MEHKAGNKMVLYFECLWCLKMKFHQAVITRLTNGEYAVATTCSKCGYHRARTLTPTKLIEEAHDAFLH